ncbi:MAG: hypothetical protein J0L81_11270 [Caulobacterales bacterium]|nr:hypothetical protein [Caulobacterales bacterium]
MSEVTERLFSYGTLQQENVQRAQFGRVLEKSAITSVWKRHWRRACALGSM